MRNGNYVVAIIGLNFGMRHLEGAIAEGYEIGALCDLREPKLKEFSEKYNIPIADIYKKGAKRTGCMFCGYGCQFKDDNRLQLVYDLYPKWYEHFMNYTNSGVTYREALRKVLAVNGLTLPDER